MSALDVACPLCGAHTGRQCRTEGPGWPTTSHVARQRRERELDTEMKQRRAQQARRTTPAATVAGHHPKG